MNTFGIIGLALFITTHAWAVQTRNCPTQIIVSGMHSDWFSSEQIRQLPHHANFTEQMFEDTETSANLVKLFNIRELEGNYQLTTKKDGRCIYHNTDKYHSITKLKRSIQLYTKQGKDFFRMDYSFKEKSRLTESFALETKIKKYSPTEFQVNEDARLRSLTTVEHDCYDRRCLTDAQIGDAHLETSVN